MLSHINTPFWVKDYQNLSLGVVLKINAGQAQFTISAGEKRSINIRLEK
jgi:hypothetical protein